MSEAEGKALAARLERLGSESAYEVANETNEIKRKHPEKKLYPFHIGDLNWRSPPHVVEATKAALDEGKTNYCSFYGIDELRSLAAAVCGGERGIEYTSGNVCVQPGGKPVINKFLLATMNEGDEVLYPSPGYPIYESLIKFHGGVPKPYGFVRSENGMTLDVAALRAAVTERTRVLIYNDCHNPTGHMSSVEEMKEIADLACKHDWWVLSDEAYFHLTYDVDHAHSIAALPGMKERTCVLITSSKSWAMTGWRIGLALGPRHLIGKLAQLTCNDEAHTCTFVQYGLCALFREWEKSLAHTRGLMVELRERRDLIHALLNDVPGFSAHMPRSTFYLFAKVDEAMKWLGDYTYGGFRRAILRDTGVSFCTRVHFGEHLPREKEHFVRFAFSGIGQDEIREAMAALKEYMELKRAQYQSMRDSGTLPSPEIPTHISSARRREDALCEAAARRLILKNRKPVVFVTREIPPLSLQRLKEAVDVDVWDGEDAPSKDVLLERARKADGLLSLLTDDIGAELLDHCPQLRVITQMAVGYNNIDVEACSERGIPVCNTPGVLTETTAETAVALVFATMRRVAEADRYVRAGKWSVAWHPLAMLGTDVHGATLGVIGMGRIGKRVSEVLLGCGVKRVLYFDVHGMSGPEEASLKATRAATVEEVFSCSDVVTIHTVLNASTKHMVSEERLRLMKKTAVLINTSRGPVVDEQALTKALQEHWIAGAGLDVFEHEPLSADSALLALENVVLLPHLGSASNGTREAMGSIAVQAQINFWSKAPLDTASILNPTAELADAARERALRGGAE